MKWIAPTTSTEAVELNRMRNLRGPSRCQDGSKPGTDERTHAHRPGEQNSSQDYIKDGAG